MNNTNAVEMGRREEALVRGTNNLYTGIYVKLQAIDLLLHLEFGGWELTALSDWTETT